MNVITGSQVPGVARQVEPRVSYKVIASLLHWLQVITRNNLYRTTYIILNYIDKCGIFV